MILDKNRQPIDVMKLLNRLREEGKIFGAIEMGYRYAKMEPDNVEVRKFLYDLFKSLDSKKDRQVFRDFKLSYEELYALFEMEERALLHEPNSTAILQRLRDLSDALDFKKSSKFYAAELKKLKKLKK